MGKAHLKLVIPAIVNRTVMPRRAKNSGLRTREYLTEHEVKMLMAATRKNRHGHRDATIDPDHTGCAPANLWTFVGIRLISIGRSCMCAGPSEASLAFTR
jgi:hypothetical protein